MKNRNMRLVLGFLVLILFVGLSGNFLGSHFSFSINDSDYVMHFRSINIVPDKHVSPGEKVFVELSANIDKIKNISLEMYSYKNKKRFDVELKDLNKKPYFILPEFDKNVVEGYSYTLDLVRVSFSNKTTATFSNSDDSGLYINLNQLKNNSITLEREQVDSAWRDFTDVRIPYNTYAKLYDNTYVILHADTRNIVNISLEFTSEDKTTTFITYLDNIDTRPYFNITSDDAIAGAKYNLSGVNVYYKEGDRVFYSTVKDNDNPYMSIGDERTITVVENIIDEGNQKSINDAEETTSNLTDVDATTKSYNTTFGGVVVLVLILLVALGIFIFLKDEDR